MAETRSSTTHAGDPGSLDLAALAGTLLAELRAALREAAFDDAFLGACEAIAPRMLDAVRLPAVTNPDVSPYLAEKAVEAVREWKFEPPLSHGAPALVAASEEFSFGNGK